MYMTYQTIYLKLVSMHIVFVYIQLVNSGFSEPAQIKIHSISQSIEANGKVVPPVLRKQSTLHYPEQALENQLHGTVFIELQVNKDGTVSHVKVVSPPSVFDAEAIIAAKRLLFMPAQENGVPIDVITQVFLHFAPPHIEPKDDLLHADHSIIVSADDLHNQRTQYSVKMDGTSVETSLQTDIARIISGVDGVVVASGTANTSKPIIRGQTERRLLMVYDGIAHANQKWGADHAPEIDVFSIGSIEIQKGVDAIQYGGEAIGGVVSLSPEEWAIEKGGHGKILLSTDSNSHKSSTSVRGEYIQERLHTRTWGNFSSQADVQTPTYVLGNTANQTWNVGTTLEWDNEGQILPAGTWNISLRHYQNSSGIFYGLVQSSIEDWQQQLDTDTPLLADTWQQGRNIGKPYQQVAHEQAQVHWMGQSAGGADMDLRYAYQQNHRQEYEQSRNSSDVAQYDFLLRTHILDFRSDHPEWFLGNVEMHNLWGTHLQLQENLYTGLSLIPNYRQISGGIYVIQRLIQEYVSFSWGLRLDKSIQNAFLSASDYGNHQRYGNSLPECSVGNASVLCAKDFLSLAATMGGIWQLVPEVWEMRFDLSRVNRFPNIDERFLLGTSPSMPVYTIGNPDIPMETVYGGQWTTAHNGPLFSQEFSVYGNYIDNYSYFAPLIVDGEVSTITTIQGTYPVYAFQAIPALFYGVDGVWTFRPEKQVSTEFGYALVRGQHIDSKKYLIGIPPDQFRLSPIWTRDAFSWKTTLRYVGKPVANDVDFASLPPAYWLWDSQLHKDIDYRNQQIILSVSGYNLLNTRYRDYNSLTRYYADAQGRNIQVSISSTW